eukprot:snap_masked-scaffold_16-processed-gene-5.22-mRNA-1 protein AED:0.69 eAED:0.69 QI:0/-1/0/1/-1/1/1/0/240
MDETIPLNPLNPGKTFLDELDHSIRLGFIRKVFTLVFLQLLFTFSCVLLSTIPSVGSTIQSPAFSILLSLSFFFMIGSTLTLTCCRHLTKKHPHNLILLGTYTFSQTVLLSYISSQINPAVISFALFTTLILVASLFYVAKNEIIDLRSSAPYLLVALLSFLIFGFVGIFVRSEGFELVYSFLGVLLFGLFLVYDIQLIIGGKHQMRYEVDEYVTAALMLYMDVIQMFLYLLRLFGERRE